MSESLHYPFIFDFKQPISGNGFLAGVEISGGRGLMLQEDDQWWMYGVFPATLSECGQTANECFLRFMEELKTVLYDFAAETGSFEEFEYAVTAFLKQTSPDEKRWLEAQQKLRSGTVKPAEENFIQSLPKESPDKRPQHFRITRLDKPIQNQPPVQFTSDDNVIWTPAMAA
jgi:hypothetical protein